jgi:hypothetical protein
MALDRRVARVELAGWSRPGSARQWRTRCLPARLNGLRVCEANGRRTLVITRKVGKAVTFPLGQHTAIDLAIGEGCQGSRSSSPLTGDGWTGTASGDHGGSLAGEAHRDRLPDAAGGSGDSATRPSCDLSVVVAGISPAFPLVC